MILEQLDGFDWEEVFKYANNPDLITGPEKKRTTSADFSMEDVAGIIAIAEGENGVDDWIGLFKLKDGRFAAVRAGCCYTGWS